ncbi:ABC transporter substrate-binding protein [Inquilinus limosus MP06]|uniref:Putative aliphatic sulfonates-binding protein n=2 Tax=Inquilinus limosus TaxID=171674 RepID=A0A0A0D4K0_9PROT|nr:ABC transporter substrate-binding protein [Inquilinus limosus MP06]
MPMHSTLSRRDLSRLAFGLPLLTLARPGHAEETALQVGDQLFGNRSVVEVSGQADNLPYRIDWKQFPAAQPLLEALNAGALDVGMMGDLSFFTVFAAGAPLRAIGAYRADPRTQAILVRSESPIQGVQDLRGKRLAGTRAGWGQFLILATLKQAGIDPSEVEIVLLPPPEARSALAAGAIDAWAVWEPYVSTEILERGARVVADGRGLSPTITLVAAHVDAIAAKHAALQDFLGRLSAGRAWVRAHPAEYARYYAGLSKIPEAVVQRSTEQQQVGFVALDDAVVAELQRAADLTVEFGILRGRVDVASTIDRSFSAV